MRTFERTLNGPLKQTRNCQCINHYFEAMSLSDPWSWPFKVFVKTLAGKRYEIRELHINDTVAELKMILHSVITPTPSKRRMRLVLGETVLDDWRLLSHCNICEGSELDLVMLPPPRSRGSRSRSSSGSASRSDTSSATSSASSRTRSNTRSYCRMVCREV